MIASIIVTPKLLSLVGPVRKRTIVIANAGTNTLKPREERHLIN